jgi:hypothetical protein
MRIYLLWILAFMLKLIGAAWDTSYHFMHLRDTFAWPHNINLIGDGLIILLLIWHTRTGKAMDRRSLRLAWLGLAIFVLAAPLDELYHRAYGLDLTAWSPTHSLLYIGTFLMLAGALGGFMQELSPRRDETAYQLVVLALLFFVTEDVLFPLGQQEYGAVALWLIEQGRGLMDAELMAFVKDPYYQAYGGFPLALYPGYLVLGYAFCMGAARRLLALPLRATLVTGVYLAYRGIAYLIFGAAGYPQSFVPYFMLAAAVLVDLLGLIQHRWVRLGAQTLGITAVAYLGAYFWGQLGVVMPPWPVDSAWVAVPAAALGFWLADLYPTLVFGQRAGLAGQAPLARAS